ncbi:MAG: TetR/AcrR family transcriptional regulator [Actinomycetota bacterium]|nr:TetR/AcrR family transcriptional regulator [Actinomycetota bacterium]
MVDRDSYHHGDLKGALVAAGLSLTRSQGPDALTVRAATRVVGVSPTAAYRHFADRDALLSAVAGAIHERMAAGMDLQHATPSRTPERAIAVLHAVGMGYIRFALDEPGWFTVAFFSGIQQLPQLNQAPPYRALSSALDALVTSELISPEQRTDAEWPCWSTVHGFAEMALRGPLNGLPQNDLIRLAHLAVNCIITGVLTAAGTSGQA